MKELTQSIDNFFTILETILTSLDIDEILTSVVEQVRTILKADRCTLYILDRENYEMYSKVLQAENLVEIRVPIKKSSLAGYSAETANYLNIKDAYDDAELKAADPELAFDKSWDMKSGYRTQSVLVIPIPFKTDGPTIGVFQALNKPGGFTKKDVEIMQQLAILIGIAVNNALLYQTADEERLLRGYIMDDIDEGICILNSKRQIISANRFLEVMSGMRYTVDMMVGENFYELFPSFQGTQLEEKINDVFEHGFKKIAQLEILEIKVIPYLDDKGITRKLILIFSRI
ncbi:MAG: GAF domain-containing sensor histidine kinase [Nitrospirae bacterium]|nr:MAG: GAF domain-containing sensor histidine kinase [Nitrospirota bacterium]